MRTWSLKRPGVGWLTMLPSNEFARISHTFSGTAVPTGAAVVYCVRIGAGQPIAETAQVCHDLFGEHFLALMTSDLAMVSTLAKEGPDDTGGSALVSTPLYTGGTGSNSEPSATSVLISKNTALGGRRNRGRMYLPGLTEPDVDDGGIIQAAYVTGLQTNVQNFLDDMDAAGLTTCVEHGPETQWALIGGQPRRVPVAGVVPDPTDCTTWTVQSMVGTQRRRQRR